MTERPRALIVGSFGGIGQAVARRLAQDGFRVALLVHSAPEPEVVAFLDTLEGSDHVWARCDLADPKQIPGVIESVVGDGPLDACIHAASPPIHRVSLRDETCDELARQFDVHVYGSLVLFQQAAKRMRGQGGRLIGITSAALDPNLRVKRMGGYLVAKAAFVGILRELAKELASDDITVNAVAPSYIATNLNRDLPERLADFVKESNPMKRSIDPQDVAGAVSFLCSVDARAITGVMIPVSGGEFMTL